MHTRALLLAALLLGTVGASTASSVRFFDPKLFKPERCGLFSRPESELDGFRAEWYGKALTSAQEPSLFERSQSRAPSSEYRFTWLPSFNHPITVKVLTKPDGALQVIAKELSGAGGYDPSRITRRVERVLSPDEAASFIGTVAKTDICHLPSARCLLGGVDGEEWIFEAVDKTGYHFTRRWSPTRGPAHDLGTAFIRLTAWAIRL